MWHYLTESGAAHQFVDGKVIQGNCAKRCTPLKEFFLQIHFSVREFFIKKIPKLGTHPRTAHNGGAPRAHSSTGSSSTFSKYNLSLNVGESVCVPNFVRHCCSHGAWGKSQTMDLQASGNSGSNPLRRD